MVSSALQPGLNEAVDRALAIVAHRALELTGATGIAIALDTDGTLVCRARAGDTAPDLGARPKGNSGITQQCVSCGEVVFCDDAQFDPRVNAEARHRLGVRSIIVVPLRQEARIIGVLEALSDEPNAFGNEQRLILQALAATIVAGVTENTSSSTKQALVAQPRVDSGRHPAALLHELDHRRVLPTATSHQNSPPPVLDQCEQAAAFGQRRAVATTIFALLCFVVLALLLASKSPETLPPTPPPTLLPDTSAAQKLSSLPAASQGPGPLRQPVAGETGGYNPGSQVASTGLVARAQKEKNWDLVALHSLAEQGNADAQYRLAKALAEGTGLPKDVIRAYAWYIAADFRGHPRSKEALRSLTPKLTQAQIGRVRFAVAQMFSTGQGVPQDYVAAYFWFTLAGAAGDRPAKKQQVELTSSMTSRQVAEATDRAEAWLARHRQIFR